MTPSGPTIVVVGADTPIRRAYALLIDALGGTALCRRPEQPVDVEADICAVVALGNDIAAALQRDELRDALIAMHRYPLLLVGIGARGEILDGLAEATGVRLTNASPARLDSYTFADQEPMLWPFAGLTLTERTPRVITPLTGDGNALQPLISARAGQLLSRLVTGGPEVFVSAISGWDGGTPPAILWRSFRPESFMDTLPVLAFVRRALGGRGWTRPTRQASCIVDDPNLRGMRYGHLDFRAAVQFARERPFHLSVGFVPIDYRSTALPVARFFRAHRDALSLLIHGNDHLRLELAREVPDRVAEQSVHQALVRMGRHQQATGLECPAVMTPPHGACTRPWVRALRSQGYVAAVATAALPYAERPEDEGAGALHEMLCAELGLYGFPIIVRYPLATPRERWLFAVWLEKPLIIYAHHEDFARGADELRARVDFINNRVTPRWVSMADLVRDNYQLRASGRTAAVRVFSNEVDIHVPGGVDEIIVVKEGRDIPWRSESILIDGRPEESTERSETTLTVVVPTHGRSHLRVRFIPGTSEHDFEVAPDNPRSKVRRLLTEGRDRLTPSVRGATSRLRRAAGAVRLT